MIPLSVPNLSGNEWKYIKDCLDTNWVSSVGSYVTLFENKVAEFCGVKYAVATSNGTTALHMNLLLSDVRRQDLVIATNITFVAPVNAVKYVGADPLLIDVDDETWQIDLNILEEFLVNETAVESGGCIHKASRRRIAALMPVHVLGNMCDMSRLMELAAEYRLTVVEDSTEALGSYYRNQHAGSFGTLGTMSFNGNKIITTGGGGMILCNDPKLAKKAKHLTTQAKADANEYYHDEVGYNYRLVNILAAMGVAQMEQLPSFLQRKKEIARRYDEFFGNIKKATPQRITDHVQSNHWLYTINVQRQDELRKYLLANKIEVRALWFPMNQLPAFANDLYISHRDVSDNIYHSCLSLPSSTGLTNDEQEKVIICLEKFYSLQSTV